MKSLVKAFITIISLLVLVLSAFSTYGVINIDKAYTSDSSLGSAAIDNYVNYKYANMSPLQRQGSLFLVSIPDQVLSQSTINFLKTYKITGVVLLGSNVQSETQLKQLTSDLRTKVDPNILISIDQEGGTVTRIKWDKYATVSAKDIGDKGDEKYAYDIAYYRAQLLKELGINIILGPVADISSGPSSFMHSRCFSTSPEKTVQFVETTVKAQKDAGITTVLKHFPGHGNTKTDSHSQFPVINASKDALMKTDFKPFEAGINAGAQMVMLGHIINPAISSKPSSTTSEYVTILREDFKFEGIVMTDDLRMTGQIKGANPLALNITIDSQANIETRIKQAEVNEQTAKQILKFKYTH